MTIVSPFELQCSDSSVGWRVSLVSAAATETVVDTLTEAADQAANAGPNQEEGDRAQHQPNPDVGSTLTIHSSEAGLLVTVGKIVHTLLVQQARLTPEGGKEAIDLTLGVLKSFVDVVLSVEEFSGGWKRNNLFMNQSGSRPGSQTCFSRNQNSQRGKQEDSSDCLHCCNFLK